MSELVQSSGRDAIKILKICNKTGINLILPTLDKYIVCGCQDGAVRFFDFQFRVVAWFEDIQVQYTSTTTRLYWLGTGVVVCLREIRGVQLSNDSHELSNSLEKLTNGLLVAYHCPKGWRGHQCEFRSKFTAQCFAIRQR